MIGEMVANDLNWHSQERCWYLFFIEMQLQLLSPRLLYVYKASMQFKSHNLLYLNYIDTKCKVNLEQKDL